MRPLLSFVRLGYRPLEGRHVVVPVVPSADVVGAGVGVGGVVVILIIMTAARRAMATNVRFPERARAGSVAERRRMGTHGTILRGLLLL